jgi:hypothetical protein
MDMVYCNIILIIEPKEYEFWGEIWSAWLRSHSYMEYIYYAIIELFSFVTSININLK